MEDSVYEIDLVKTSIFFCDIVCKLYGMEVKKQEEGSLFEKCEKVMRSRHMDDLYEADKVITDTVYEEVEAYMDPMIAKFVRYAIRKYDLMLPVRDSYEKNEQTSLNYYERWRLMNDYYEITNDYANQYRTMDTEVRKYFGGSRLLINRVEEAAATDEGYEKLKNLVDSMVCESLKSA
ncbi:MAG: hypothetical protein K6A23_09940 [Butyrivibrio sp.]|nr:hypothetical protein [Butyrivibrio sp.]